ncbi:MAG: cytochrome c biogenesis CcdA family protein [Candidatus Limnocylindrales bacterium]
MQLTLAAAFLAGLISFLSPCVLPVVPAYLGQLGVLAVAPSRRWHLLPHAIAFVLGFGAVFTLLGLTVYVGGSVLGLTLPVAWMTWLRQLGGIVLIVLGLNLAGILRFDVLQRSWRPFDAVLTQRAMATAVAAGSGDAGNPGSAPVSATAIGRAAAPGLGRSPLAAFGLGAIFAVGWTPCIGPTLGAILGLSALGPSAQVVALFVAYSAGLAVPFLVMALALERSRALTGPLLRHGRQVEVIGGLLVAAIGVALLFDWLSVLASTFAFLTPSV